MSTVTGQVTDDGQVGVFGESTLFEGVRGLSHSAGHGGVVGINDNQSDNAGQGVFGVSDKGEGVRGISHSPHHGGVVGTNDNAGAGVHGESSSGEGVRGISHSSAHAAVAGTNDNPFEHAGAGVFGESKNGEGVRGVSHGLFHAAVVGTNDAASENAGAGVFGESKNGEGVRGISHSPVHAAVVGTNDHPSGVGVFAKAERLAGQFEGNVDISGNLTIQGVSIQSWLQRIVALERELVTLNTRIAALESRSGSSGGGTSTPKISVSQGGSSGQKLVNFTISGSGFGRNEDVTIKVVSRSKFGNPSSSDTPTVADSTGNISHTIALFCDGGMQHEFTAVSASGRTSNSESSSC